MKNYYFTFGQQYRDEPHPSYPKANPNGWVRIVAEDWEKARIKAFDLFGASFSFQYSEHGFDPKYFPMGEIECIQA